MSELVGTALVIVIAVVVTLVIEWMLAAREAVDE